MAANKTNNPTIPLWERAPETLLGSLCHPGVTTGFSGRESYWPAFHNLLTLRPGPRKGASEGAAAAGNGG
jgi:hypothetical protein